MDVKLIFSKDNGETKDIPITEASTVIGRAKDCTLRIPIESCSRRQCELILENGTFTLRDLNSSNGTIVNNTPTDEKVLVPGDRITIGPVTLTVSIDGVSSIGKPQAASAPEPEMEELVSESIADEAPADDLEDLLVVVDDEEPAGKDPLASLAGGGPSIDDDDPLAALSGLGGSEDEEDEDDGIDLLASLADGDDEDADDDDDDDPLAALASLTE